MRAIRVALAAAACVAAVACFEEPVREHLHLTVFDDDGVVVTIVQDVAAPAVAENNPPLAARLDETRDAIERGYDRWRPLFDELEPAVERTTIDKVDGTARRAVYSAAVTDFDRVARLLGALGLGATLDHQPVDERTSEHELRLVPVGSPPASPNERREVERRLDEWAAVVADYLAEATVLYEHLDRRPDRAVPCLSHLFDRHGPEPTTLDAGEEELVARVKDRIHKVASVLEVAPGEAYTLNELSRLAFDPCPARLTVDVRGEPLAVEGLIEGDGFVERPAVDLWRALASLEGRWLAPDLVTAMIAPVPHGQQPDPDPEAFAAIARRWTRPPAPADVADALRAALVPPEQHVVRWRTVAGEDIDLEDDDPSAVLDPALARVPP